MLIGISANHMRVTLHFAAVNNIGSVARAVEITWEEAKELHSDLALLLEQGPDHVPEENRRRDFAG